MKGRIGRNAGLALGLLMATLLVPSVLVGAENCDKARKEYDRGTQLHDFGERLKAFKRATELCPSFAEAHVNLADAYENLALSSKEFSQRNLRENNRYLDMAIKEYQTALKYNDRSFEAYLGLAENYFRTGLYEKAQRAYKQCSEVDPNHRLMPRAKAGRQKLEQAMSQQKKGFKTAGEIVKGLKQASQGSSPLKLMGFQNRVVALARVRFDNILFNEWSHDLTRPETLAQLKEIGTALSSADLRNCRFIVEGHTDDRGGLDRNRKLSEDRAAAVKKYLETNFGVSPVVISAQGFGYSRPRFPNDSPEHLLKNRRVELIIIQ